MVYVYLQLEDGERACIYLWCKIAASALAHHSKYKDTRSMEECINLSSFEKLMLLSQIRSLQGMSSEKTLSYDKGVLAEILQPIMGKGLMPVDIDAWKLRRRA
ncbi:Uncharacterized protein Rs2_41421 [Raphanus sativus]|nr:Uncharacterized protein Rs2_41421 [Raphanus sativus]